MGTVVTKRHRPFMPLMLTLFAVSALFLLIAAGMGINFSVSVVPEYNKAVRGHINLARSASDLDLIESEINLSISGMRELGLDEGLYGSVFEWKKTPDNCMRAQYDKLDSVLRRIDEMRQWLAIMKNGSLTGEIVTDQYDIKMDAIRSDIDDSIAYRSWLAKNHPFHAAGGLIWLSVTGGLILVAGLVCIMPVICREVEYLTLDGKPVRKGSLLYYGDKTKPRKVVSIVEWDHEVWLEKSDGSEQLVALFDCSWP